MPPTNIMDWAKAELATATPSPAPKGISAEAIAEKVQAGLSRDQAIAVLTQQAEHDAELGEEPKAKKSSKAAKPQKEAEAPEKKPAAKAAKAPKAPAKKISGDGKDAAPGNAENANAE